MYALIHPFFHGLKPVPRVPIWKWADENRVLTSESSSEKGNWKSERVPHMYQIMEDLSPTSPVQQVIVCKGIQLAFTESAMNLIGCFIDIDPCPILYVMPNLTDAKKISRKRLDPMIKNSKSLSKKIRPARERDSGNNVLSKIFPGGSVDLVGAESPSALASQSIRILILDETDRYPLDVGSEGSPISLAEKRTVTFQNRKIFKISTPTIKGVSPIEHELSSTEHNEYHIPCPECSALQVLKFSQFRWEPGKPETVKYHCEHCGEEIEERKKPWFLHRDRACWIPKYPERVNPKRKGYHISSLYSPFGWLYWHEIIAQYEEAKAKEKEDPSLMKTFVNTILGETYESIGEAPPFQNLYNRREGYSPGKIPKEVCFLTAGVDVQKDRLEMEIVGWSNGKVTHSIDFIVIDGMTDDQKTWDKLQAIIERTYLRDDGAEMTILCTGVDSGYNTTEVYSFCRRFDGTKVVPMKGQDRQITILSNPKRVDITKKGRKVGVVNLWNVGINVVKSEVYNYLKIEKNEDGSIPPGYCFFPQYELEHFKRLTAESLIIQLVRGIPRQLWTKHYERNEQLDCRVYARAAAAICGLDRMKPDDFKRMSEIWLKTSNVGNKTAKKSKKPSIWDR